MPVAEYYYVRQLSKQQLISLMKKELTSFYKWNSLYTPKLVLSRLKEIMAQLDNMGKFNWNLTGETYIKTYQKGKSLYFAVKPPGLYKPKEYTKSDGTPLAREQYAQFIKSIGVASNPRRRKAKRNTGRYIKVQLRQDGKCKCPLCDKLNDFRFKQNEICRHVYKITAKGIVWHSMT